MAINKTLFLSWLISEAKVDHPAVDCCRASTHKSIFLEDKPQLVVVFLLLFAILILTLFFASFKISMIRFGKTLPWILFLNISMLSVTRFAWAFSFILVQMSGFWWRNGGRFFVGIEMRKQRVSQKLRYHLQTVSWWVACVTPCHSSWSTACSQQFSPCPRVHLILRRQE